VSVWKSLIAHPQSSIRIPTPIATDALRMRSPRKRSRSRLAAMFCSACLRAANSFCACWVNCALRKLIATWRKCIHGGHIAFIQCRTSDGQNSQYCAICLQGRDDALLDFYQRYQLPSQRTQGFGKHLGGLITCPMDKLCSFCGNDAPKTLSGRIGT